MQVTDFYNIAEEDPFFLNVHVDRDNLLYLDPFAIRQEAKRYPSDHGESAVACMKSFFETVAACAISTRAGDQQRGEKLLQTFNEPSETRLGMSKEGYQGKGAASQKGTEIWNNLRTDAQGLLNVGIFHMLEELPVFVDGVGADVTSDLTTRIIFEPLALFTRKMLTEYPQLTSGNHKTEAIRRNVWDSQAKTWMEKEFLLPVADNHPLLLVPRNWARASVVLDYGGFYQKGVLTYAQRQHSVVLSDGKISRPSKKNLSKQERYQRGRKTVIAVVQEAERENELILQDFKQLLERDFSFYSREKLAAALAKEPGAQDYGH